MIMVRISLHCQPFFNDLKEPDGLQRILQQFRKIKLDFREKKIMIFTGQQVNGT